MTWDRPWRPEPIRAPVVGRPDAGARRTPAAPRGRPAVKLQALQRQVGNAAVCALLNKTDVEPVVSRQTVDDAIARRDIDAVKAVDPRTPFDDARRTQLIEIVLDQTWVGPSDETWLERCWGALDADGLLRFATAHADLWDRCRDRGAELDDLPTVAVIRRRFADDVLALARAHLRNNRRLVERELDEVGLGPETTAPRGPVSDSQAAHLAAIQAAASSLANLQRAQEAARGTIVGWRIGDGGDVDPDWTGREVKYQVPFDPHGPAPELLADPGPDVPNGDIFVHPVAAYDEVRDRYDQASRSISGLVAAHPALFGMARYGGSGATSAFADTDDPEPARMALGSTLRRVLSDIDRTGGLLGTDLDPLDLTPLHEQLHSGTAEVGTIHWIGGFGWRVASEASRDHAVSKALTRLLLQNVTELAFLLAPFTSGATLLVVLGTATAATAVNAYGSYQEARNLATAEGTAVAPGTDLVRPGSARFAQMQAEADAIAFGLALLALGTAGLQAWKAGAEVRGLRAQARSLVREARARGQVVVNIGGAGAPHEPAGAINLNPQVPGTERAGIPNLLQAEGERIGELFAPGSVDRIEGHNLAGGAIDWDRVADGSARALRPGGSLEVYFRGAHDGAEQFGRALRRNGFSRVDVVSDVLIRATK